MDKRILLVDDEVEVVNFMAYFLKRLRISAIKATSGEEALKLYDKNTVDLVFMDVQMGGMDGLMVLDKIKSINPEAKVIMITGKTDTEYQDKAKELGALDYIIKPINLSEFKEKIDKYILQG